LNKGFTDHHYRLMLDRKLYLATIRLQADKGLGKSFSAMLPFVEGLHSMGYLSDEDYEVYKAKYSIGLQVAANAPTEADILRMEKGENKNKQLNRHYSEVLRQWPTLSEQAKKYHLKTAEENKHLKNARLVLDLVKPDGAILV